MKFDKLIQRLQESTSPLRRLYHYTDLSKAVKIITQNKFELTYAKGPDASKLKGFRRNFYISCSTIARGRYATGMGGKFYSGSVQCNIELDASKLSDKYKISPVDYWYYPGQARMNSAGTNEMDETEERILSRDHKIPNAKKYIIAVHIYVPPEDRMRKMRQSEEQIGRIQEEIKLIAHSGVDYYIYDDIKYFTVLRREKAHKLKSDTYQYELRHMDNPSRYDLKNEQELTWMVDWLLDPNFEIPDEMVKSRLEAWNWKDLLSTVDNEIHNVKAKMRPATQRALHKLSEYQRKTGKSLSDIVQDAYYRGRERY
jgi:hypothetical protein